MLQLHKSEATNEWITDTDSEFNKVMIRRDVSRQAMSDEDDATKRIQFDPGLVPMNIVLI